MTNEGLQNMKTEYGEIISIIERARQNAFRAVNHELISMYWDIGKYTSEKTVNGGWRKAVVTDFSQFIQSMHPEIKGFSPQNIWRMKQFYETYSGNEKLSALLRDISWTNNLAIMSVQKLMRRVSSICSYARKTNTPPENWSAKSIVCCLGAR